jgi:two-component system cell cycle response regulator
VGNPQIVTECKGFEDTRNWTFYDSIEDARNNLGKVPAVASPQLATA